MRRAVAAVVAPTRLNLAAVGAAGTALAAAHLLLPYAGLPADVVEVSTYASYLVVFTIWMVWFVFTGVRAWRAVEGR